MVSFYSRLSLNQQPAMSSLSGGQLWEMHVLDSLCCPAVLAAATMQRGRSNMHPLFMRIASVALVALACLPVLPKYQEASAVFIFIGDGNVVIDRHEHPVTLLILYLDRIQGALCVHLSLTLGR